jgi:hypothetical protein
MDLSQVGDWCAADPRLYLSSTDPLRISFFEPDGSAIPTSVVGDGRFLRFATRIDLQPETLELVRDADVRHGLDDYLVSVVRGRSSLSHVLISPDGSCVDIEVAVYEDGLNGHTFLVAVQELFNLKQIVAPALAGLALSIAALRDSRSEITAADEARRRAEQELERLQQETMRQEAEALARVEALKKDLAPSSTAAQPNAAGAPSSPYAVPAGASGAAGRCKACNSELQAGARFCIVCGVAIP